MSRPEWHYGLALAAGIYVALASVGAYYFGWTGLGVAVIAASIVCLLAMAKEFIDGEYLGDASKAASIFFVLIAIISAFPTGIAIQADIDAQQAAAGAQQARLQSFIANNTHDYIGTVSYAKIWDTQSCNNNLLVPVCSAVPNENITVTVPQITNITLAYRCNYFTTGQTVKVHASPSVFYQLPNGSNIASVVASMYILPASANLKVTGMTYAIEGAPSGC